MERKINVKNIDKYISYHEADLKRSLRHDISQKEFFDIIKQSHEIQFEIQIPKEVEREIEKSIFDLVESITKKI